LKIVDTVCFAQKVAEPCEAGVEHKAWGVSPRNRCDTSLSPRERVKAATMRPVARFTGSWS